MYGKRIGIYARYSTDDQRLTSIEDQQRNCIESLKRFGFDVSNCRMFSDAAISGSSEKTASRVGLQDFLTAWDNGEFDIVMADEVSRLARGALELAQMRERVKQTNVRFLTADGHDSSSQNFDLSFGLASVMATHALEETRRRVRRSMKGQLERGFMVGYPAFGYEAYKVKNGDRVEGTKWELVPAKAEIVRKVYELRSRGTSLAAIATYLNQREVPPPRKPRKGSLSYWRPGTVFQLLTHTVYRGVIVWNGSGFLRARAKKQNRVLEPETYLRPQLRIVSDELWNACNAERRPWKRGGGKSAFAGIVRCGDCSSVLTVNRGSKREQVYCAQCEQAYRVGARNDYIGYLCTR
jgi:DNA invertase Pin-like site-specific DNA recombinase